MSDHTPPRDELPAGYQWDVGHLYPDRAAWDTDRAAVAADCAALAAHQGRLGDSPQRLLTALELRFGASRRLARVAGWADRRYHQDLRDQDHEALTSLVTELRTTFGRAVAWMEPELLALPPARLADLAADPGLADYDQWLRDLQRQRDHVRSAEVEELLAEAGRVAAGPYKTYATFSDGDLIFPEVDVDGEAVTLTKPLFTRYRAHADRATRERVFAGLFGTYATYENTCAALLGSQLATNHFYARARRYDSCLRAALDEDNLDPAFYHALQDAIDRHLPTLHRYLDVRRRTLGLRELHYHDLYVSLVPGAERGYSYEQARELVTAACAPLGKEYAATLARGLDPASGWVDVLPNQGKLSGAYMSGSAYDVHPYVLLNFTGEYDAVSTVAHEYGHALHSHLSNNAQPWPRAGYSIFVAEIASTVNEVLLNEHVRRVEPELRRFLLGELLESFRTTVFRQAMFAAFELEVHQLVEAGEPITAAVCNERYAALLARFYGDTVIAPAVQREWAYIPHFYYDFYVYQYATGFCSAAWFARRLLDGGEPERDAYLELLRAGGSDYPLPLLARAGLDLTSPEPYDVALGWFARVLDEFEEVA